MSHEMIIFVALWSAALCVGFFYLLHLEYRRHIAELDKIREAYRSERQDMALNTYMTFKAIEKGDEK